MRNFAYFLIAGIGLWVAHLSQEINSDHHSLSTFIMDFLRDPSLVRGWVFQAAHFYFPEIPFVLPFQALGISFATCIFLFMVMIAGVHAWSFYRLQQALGPDQKNLAAFAGLWFSWLGLLVYSIQQWKTSVPIYDLYFHSGQSAGGFLVLILFLFGDPRQVGRTWKVLGFFLLSLLLLSDQLFIVQFELPLLTVLVIRAWRTKDWKFNLKLCGFLISANVLSALLSWAITRWNLFGTLYIPILKVATPAAAWNMLKNIVQVLAGSHEIVLILIIACWGLFQIFRRSSSVEKLRWTYFIVCGLLSLGGTVLAVALKGLWYDFSEMRYMTNWIIYPWFIIGTFIWQFSPAKRAIVGIILAVCLTAGYGFFNRLPADQGPPPGLQCLLKAQTDFALHAGLTSYWDAKKLRYFSGGRLNTIQVENDFKIFDLGSNRYWLRPAEAGNTTVNYVIVNRAHPTYINYEDSLKKFGAPEKIIECGDFQLLIYRPLAITSAAEIAR